MSLTKQNKTHIFSVFILLLILLRFFVFGWTQVVAHSNSNDGDQGVTLQLGLDLKEHRMLSDGTRNPLYPTLLLPFAQREWQYFTWAKIVSLLAGGLAVLAVYLVGKQLGSSAGALIAAFLLSINFEFLFHTTTALAEGLLVLTFFVGWFFVGQALTLRDNPRYWIAAGAFSALAYLTKGTGNFLLLTGGATALLFYWQHPKIIIRSLTLFSVTFLIVASPLLIYNYKVFGNPTYNFATTHAMWLDKWRQSWVEDPSTLPTAMTYISTHTPQEAFTRFIEGVQALWKPFWQTMLPVKAAVPESIVLSVWGWIGILITAIVLMVGYRTYLTEYLKRSGKLLFFSAFVTVLVYVMFAWYTDVVIGTRFLLILLPIVYFFAGEILWLLIKHLGNTIDRVAGINKYCFSTVGLGVLVSVWLLGTMWGQLLNLQNPFKTDIENNIDTEHVLAWLEQGEPEGASVVWGPGHSLPTWKYSDKFDVHILPGNLKSLSEITNYLLENNIDYVILDELMTRRYKERFKDYVAYQTGRLELLDLIPGWDLAYLYKDYPSDWIVFSLKPQHSFTRVPEVIIEDKIQLLGYRMATADVTAGEIVSVWLYWQNLSEVDQDYTVFTHLVGPGGLQGQIDRQPFNALWPTSRWFSQSIVVDRFDIPVALDASPGNYQIYVGMYTFETGQRLTLQKQGQSLADNAFVIDGITLSYDE